MLVIVFVFHILVFSISFIKVASIPLREIKPDIASYSKGNVQFPSFEDVPSHNTSSFRTQKPMFQILRNLTTSVNNNLKSNIFDKMLSEEMLLIKQKFFEKDLVPSTTGMKVNKNSAPTPTIEVQQKWSVVDLFTNPVQDTTARSSDSLKIENSVNAYEAGHNINSVYSDMELKDLYSKSDNVSAYKVLELRSLPAVRHSEGIQGLQHQHVSSKCSCTRQSKSSQECTHTVSDSSVQFSYSLYPLYVQPYQTFYFSDNIESPYHMYTTKKPKHRKTTPNSIDIYYDDNKSKENRYDNDDDEDYEYKSRPKHKTCRPDVIMNIDYDLVDEKPKKSHKGYVDNLLSDLNQVYNEGVKKKCFCSQAALLLSDQRNTFNIFMILQTLKLLHDKILLFE